MKFLGSADPLLTSSWVTFLATLLGSSWWCCVMSMAQAHLSPLVVTSVTLTHRQTVTMCGNIAMTGLCVNV